MLRGGRSGRAVTVLYVVDRSTITWAVPWDPSTAGCPGLRCATAALGCGSPGLRPRRRGV